MALIRGHHAFDDHFTQIPNDWVRDERLSLEARGLIAQIMSHRPGWNLSIKSLAARNHIGRDKVKRILDELLKHGYLERSQKQSHDERGHLAGFDYTTKDPQGVTQKPSKAKPYKGEPDKADRPPKKNILIEEQSSEKNIDIESSFAKFWDVYPRKLGKGEAFKAFEKAVRKHGADVVMDGVRCLASDPNLPEPQFIPRAATWLNGERWGDDPYPPKQPSGVGRFVKPAAEGPGRRAWVRSLHDQGEHWECRAGEFGCK